MYVSSIYKYFQDFRMPVENSASKSKQPRNRSEFQTPPNAIGRRDCLCVVLTRSAPNARPIGPYSTHLWVPRRRIGADGEWVERSREEMEMQEGMQDPR